MLRLIVPKHVEFNNFRLQVLFNFLQITTFVLLCLRFFEAKLWVRSMDIGHSMNAELWVKPLDPDRIAEVWREQAAGPVCSSPELFDFLWGGEDGVAFLGHECLPPCSTAGAGAWPRCVQEVETHRREADDQVFFVTQYEERQIAADGRSESTFAFVPLENAHTLGLQYRYSVPFPWWPGSFSAAQLQSKMPTDGRIAARSDGNGPEGERILTVLLDQKGDVHRVIEPLPVLDIPLPELLELAGVRDAMHSPNTDLGPNWQVGALYPEGGIGRITGINIDLHIECFQSQPDKLPGRDTWHGPVCYAKAEQSSTKSWASWETVEAFGVEGAIRQRLHHGVRARVIMEGHVDVFDANSLFIQLTASLVFLALPGQFMYFFINYTLGHLSTVYQGVLIELFDIQMECARLTARLMSNSVTFVELEDVSPDTDHPVGCISRRRVEEQLREVLRYRGATLDEEEIAGVVHFCHQAVMRSETLCRRVKPLRQFLGAVKDGSAFRTAKSFAGASALDLQVHDIDPGVITIDSFSMCCAASSQMEFESFVRLFDKDRGVTVLEKFFLPPKLRPSTLILGGRECSASTAGGHHRSSLFNLHDRHQAQIAVLKDLRKTDRHTLGNPDTMADQSPASSHDPSRKISFGSDVPPGIFPVVPGS